MTVFTIFIKKGRYTPIEQSKYSNRAFTLCNVRITLIKQSIHSTGVLVTRVGIVWCVLSITCRSGCAPVIVIGLAGFTPVVLDCIVYCIRYLVTYVVTCMCMFRCLFVNCTCVYFFKVVLTFWLLI